MAVISERLNELKDAKNLLQKDVAEGAGVPLRTYQRYENGEREPSASIIIMLADFFNVSADYLLGRTDNPAMAKGA